MDPWTSRVQIHACRRRPGRVKDRGAGAGAERARRKQAPKTRRASETKALRAMWSRATFVARAAPRRAANAGHVRWISSESDSRSRSDRRENRRSGSVGSPRVATGRGESFTGTMATPSRGTPGWGEAKITGSGRSPPGMSRGAWGEEKSWEASGSPPVAGASSLGSQKDTSTPCATWEVGRTRTNVRHSVRQAAVRLSPFQQAGMRMPLAVHPGHAPSDAWYLMGHSKAR